MVRALALRAGVPRFSTHTPRHLCLTDLARARWELHEIARFAGHRNPTTTLLATVVDVAFPIGEKRIERTFHLPVAGTTNSVTFTAFGPGSGSGVHRSAAA